TCSGSSIERQWSVVSINGGELVIRLYAFSKKSDKDGMAFPLAKRVSPRRHGSHGKILIRNNADQKIPWLRCLRGEFFSSVGRLLRRAYAAGSYCFWRERARCSAR